MATLEKIRSKSVLLFIIIIVALLAFILGDFLTSGRTYFGSGMTVAKAGKVTVGYNEYQSRISELSEQQREQSQGREQSSDVVSAQALEQLIVEGLLDREYKDLGIVVTDAELSEAMYGKNSDPQATQTISYLSRALGLETPDAAAVHDAIENPTRYNIPAADAAKIAEIWKDTEDNIEDNLLSEKFGRLITGLYTYNKLDAKAIYDDVATTRHIAYVNKDIASITDTTITVSDAEVRALWNERKNTYKLDEETRLVNYIMVRIEPSRDDRIAAQNTVEEALVNLNAGEGMDAVSTDSRFVIENGTAPLSRVNNSNLKSFLDSAAVGNAATISTGNDSYTLAKLLNKTTGIDSINISIVQTAASLNDSTKAYLDSVATALNSGALATDFNGDKTAGRDSLWMSLIGGDISEQMETALTDAALGKAFVYTDSLVGNFVFKVNKRNAPVAVYDFALATYAVDPSLQTLDELSGNLRTYVSNNSGAADFANEENTRAAGYALLSDEVSASSVRIGNAEDSRRFVKWVMEADKGQVSPVFQDDKQTYLIALSVADIYKGYRPYTNERVYSQLESEALNTKKAEQLLSLYNGAATDLEGYATALGTEVSEGDVNINSPMLLNIGFRESALAGAIAAADQGRLVGPIKGNRGILVFEVRNIDTANRPFNEEEYGQQFIRTFNPIGSQSPEAFLLGKNKVDNKSLNFISNPAE